MIEYSELLISYMQSINKSHSLIINLHNSGELKGRLKLIKNLASSVYELIDYIQSGEFDKDLESGVNEYV